MKIVVAMAAYNSETTIEAALDSVWTQTKLPHGVVVVDDGSTDATAELLRTYGSRVKVVRQENRGVVHARNELVRRVAGDLVAFLDADDVWHPEVLAAHTRAFDAHPDAVASFVGHVDFRGLAPYQWDDTVDTPPVQLIEPETFLRRYYAETGPFASMSFCCVPRWVLDTLGDEPFGSSGGVDDAHLLSLLPHHGPVAFQAVPLVAYRITPSSLSADRLTTLAAFVRTCLQLQQAYADHGDRALARAFDACFAAKEREYAKLLMGVGRDAEARQFFRASLKRTNSPAPVLKALSTLLSTYAPRRLQPRWPGSLRG